MALALIYTRDYEKAGIDRQLLVREEKSGKLTRLRRGVYVPSAEYRALPWWEQRLLHIDAVVGTRRSEHVLIQQSAAALWGIPTIGRSFDVLVLARDGTHGRARAGVRHHARLLLEPAVRHNGFMVTSRAQTAVDIAAYCRFEEAVPVMDHVLRNDPARRLRALEPEQLSRLAESLPAGRRRRFERVLSFATPSAQSAGESYSRALIYLHRFPQPELQVPMFDSRGVRIAVVDYYWRANRLAGEFDGSVKYGRNEYLQGQLPADVLMQEKQREDKIRATGVGMARWMWGALFPAGGNQLMLTQQLIQAGLRQDHRHLWDGM